MPDELLTLMRIRLDWHTIAGQQNLDLSYLVKWYAESVDQVEYDARFMEWINYLTMSGNMAAQTWASPRRDDLNPASSGPGLALMVVGSHLWQHRFEQKLRRQEPDGWCICNLCEMARAAYAEMMGEPLSEALEVQAMEQWGSTHAPAHRTIFGKMAADRMMHRIAKGKDRVDVQKVVDMFAWSYHFVNGDVYLSACLKSKRGTGHVIYSHVFLGKPCALTGRRFDTQYDGLPCIRTCAEYMLSNIKLVQEVVAQ